MIGLVPGLAFDEYRRAPGTNVSALKELSRSPRHYQFRLNNPKESAALKMGSVCHTAVLEPHRFLAEYVLWDKRDDEDGLKRRRGKDWKAFEAEARDAGKRVVTDAEYKLALSMRDAVRTHSAAMRYLHSGQAEVSMFWQDAETGRNCKGRIDWLTTSEGDVLAGLKTARTAHPIGFGNAAARLGYHLQWAYYRDGYQAITGKSARMVEIVVENTPPYDVVVFVIPDEVIDAGQEEYREHFKKLAECEASGSWPGLAAEEQVLSLPSWVYGADDDLSDLDLDMEATDGAQEAG